MALTLRRAYAAVPLHLSVAKWSAAAVPPPATIAAPMLHRRGCVGGQGLALPCLAQGIERAYEFDVAFSQAVGPEGSDDPHVLLASLQPISDPAECARRCEEQQAAPAAQRPCAHFTYFVRTAKCKLFTAGVGRSRHVTFDAISGSPADPHQRVRPLPPPPPPPLLLLPCAPRLGPPASPTHSVFGTSNAGTGHIEKPSVGLLNAGMFCCAQLFASTLDYADVCSCAPCCWARQRAWLQGERTAHAGG